MSPLSDWRCIKFLESIDARLDDAVDLVGGAVMELRQQSELGQHLSEELAGILDGPGFHIGLVDHAVLPSGDGRARALTEMRAEGEGRISIRPQFMRVVEAMSSTAADGANSYPVSSELLRPWFVGAFRYPL